MTLQARSPRYPALYDELSGVVFRKGRAEVTEEQALQLAERRFVDGIVIVEVGEDGVETARRSVKEWARDRRRDAGEDEVPAVLEEGEFVVTAESPGEPPVGDAPPLPQPEPDAGQGTKTRKAR